MARRVQTRRVQSTMDQALVVILSTLVAAVIGFMVMYAQALVLPLTVLTFLGVVCVLVLLLLGGR